MADNLALMSLWRLLRNRIVSKRTSNRDLMHAG